jgi:hypothetical protein
VYLARGKKQRHERDRQASLAVVDSSKLAVRVYCRPRKRGTDSCAKSSRTVRNFEIDRSSPAGCSCDGMPLCLKWSSAMCRSVALPPSMSVAPSAPLPAEARRPRRRRPWRPGSSTPYATGWPRGACQRRRRSLFILRVEDVGEEDVHGLAALTGLPAAGEIAIDLKQRTSGRV